MRRTYHEKLDLIEMVRMCVILLSKTGMHLSSLIEMQRTTSIPYCYQYLYTEKFISLRQGKLMNLSIIVDLKARIWMDLV